MIRFEAVWVDLNRNEIPLTGNVCDNNLSATMIRISNTFVTLLHTCLFVNLINYPDSKVHGANMGPIWGRQDPGGPHVGPMNIAIWVCNTFLHSVSRFQQDKQLTIDTDDILVTVSCYSWNMSQYFRVLLPGATLSKISQEILRHDADFKHSRFRCHSDSLTWSDFKLFIFLNK